MNNYKKWQNADNSQGKRSLALGVGAVIFPIGIPAILVFFCPPVDALLGIGSFFIGSINVMVGATAIIVGGIIGFWTIIAQMKLASGTPFPMLPTKKLIIVGPYAYCRNPMTLGTVIAYSGIGILIGSSTAILAIGFFAAVLIAYLKNIEEKELELRFGQEYVEYKKSTPFILPNIFAKVEKDNSPEK